MYRNFCITLLCWLAIWCGWAGTAAADEPSEGVEPEPGEPAAPKWKLRTLGGKQFWADELHFHAWRIQRNVLTGHHRLLDPRDQRHAWGTFDECHARLEAIKQDRKLPPMQGEAVIVLHGLFRSRTAMENMCAFLRDQGGYTVASISYPTTRGELRDHAQSLASVLAHLDGIDRIHFVAHSLGNLVIRHYLADATDPATGRTPDSRIGRFVMLGPPNHGAEIAGKLIPLDVTGQIAGMAARQIARDWPGLEAKLATPACEFGILAGGRAGEQGFNPLLTGDNDLVVEVASTRLAGARDFRVLPVVHTVMMNDAKVQAFTLHFLQHGCFEAEEKREPIEEARKE